MTQLTFFDADKRLAALSKQGDPLEAMGGWFRGRSFAARSRPWC